MDHNTQLAVLVLEWAKSNHPDKYQQTLGVSGRPEAFLRYMVRLLELRWQEDRSIEFRRLVPLWALELTNIRQKMRLFGKEIEVCGEKVKPRVWGFDELAMLGNVEKPVDHFALIFRAKERLDLERV